MQRIYLDNNATTKVDDDVASLVTRYLSQEYGNPNSLHSFGTEIHGAMSKALEQLYRGINGRNDDDIIINSCATEGNNSVVMGVYYDLIRTGKKNKIIASEVEHPAIMEPLLYLKSIGVDVEFIAINSSGVVDVETLRKALTPDTALVTIMWANNETGLVFPIKELCLASHESGALFHTDAVQVIGKLPVDVQEVDVDFLTFSAHKFHGPKGIGALYLKKGRSLTPLLHGGDQMSGKRGGTVNVAFMIAMGEAMERSVAALPYEMTEVKRLRDKLEIAIKSINETIIIGYGLQRTPNTTLVSFKGIEGEAMLWDLNKNGVAASTGSACSSEDLQANHTFRAMSIESDLAHTGIRFSLSRLTTESEIDYAIEVIKKSVARLRDISIYSVNS